MPFNSLAVFHFLFCFFWFVVAIHRPLFFFFVTHSQFRTLAVALADSHSHSHSRSFTCLLVQLAYSPFLKWFCLIATLSITRIFFSASISIPNRIPMSKKDHMNRMNCHWMTHTNAKTVTYALFGNLIFK